MVGSLMYAMLATRPDLSFSLSVVSRFLENPTQLHCSLVQHIFKYLRQNDYVLNYSKGNCELKGYVDASYANQHDSRSTTGILLFLGNNLIFWQSSKQGCYTHSAAEAEYVGISSYIKELLWQQQLLLDMNQRQSTTVTFEDNQSAIAMATNPQANHNKRTKHIQVAYHSTRDYIKKGILN
jgi:hypothetical protein